MTVRFAPSPTGRFHLGNLRTAWISRELSRMLGFPWWVRFEDIDTPRVISGAQDQQLEDLARLGLIPDHIEVQSRNRWAHWNVFRALVQAEGVYPCVCSRKEIEQELTQLASAPSGMSPVYPKTCFKRGKQATLALLQPGRLIVWRIQGSHVGVAKTRSAEITEPEQCGFEPAYHWACAIDDAREDPCHRWIVRAWDLESATPIQRAIQRLIYGPNFLYPGVFHTSLIVREDGHRLEKRTQGITLPELESQGVSPEVLLRSFEASFDRSKILSLDSGEVSGETLHTLPISHLLGLPRRSS